MPCSRSSLDVAMKWADKPDSNFREGSSAEIGICSRPVWVSVYGGKSSKRLPWQWWIFRWIFAVEFFWSQNAKEKSTGKSASRKHKTCRRTTPPKSTSQTQKSAAKPTNKSACSISKYTPGVFRLRRFALATVFRAWILGHSLVAFWAWSRFPC